jgi:hypothetical protein
MLMEIAPDVQFRHYTLAEVQLPVDAFVQLDGVDPNAVSVCADLEQHIFNPDHTEPRVVEALRGTPRRANSRGQTRVKEVRRAIHKTAAQRVIPAAVRTCPLRPTSVVRPRLFGGVRTCPLRPTYVVRPRLFDGSLPATALRRRASAGRLWWSDQGQGSETDDPQNACTAGHSRGGSDVPAVADLRGQTTLVRRLLVAMALPRRARAGQLP